MGPVAGIVLAGGRSTRMGRSKAFLDWQGGTLLAHVVRVLAEAVDGPVVVVRAPRQRLPALPAGVEIAVDAAEGRGPLEGIAAGLRRVIGRAEAAFVSSTDVPFLEPAFVACVVRGLDDTVDAAVPFVEGLAYPLSAAYRVSLLPTAEALLSSGELRASLLATRSRTRYLGAGALLSDPVLARIDPELRSLADIDDAAAYRRAQSG